MGGEGLVVAGLKYLLSGLRGWCVEGPDSGDGVDVFTAAVVTVGSPGFTAVVVLSRGGTVFAAAEPSRTTGCLAARSALRY